MERCEWLERATAQRSKLKQLELVAVWYWLFLSWRVSADPGSLEVPNRDSTTANALCRFLRPLPRGGRAQRSRYWAGLKQQLLLRVAQTF